MLTTVMRISQIRNASIGPRAESKRSLYNSNGIMISVLPSGTNESKTTTVIGNNASLVTVNDKFYLGEETIQANVQQTPFTVNVPKQVELNVSQATATVSSTVLPKFTLEITNA